MGKVDWNVNDYKCLKVYMCVDGVFVYRRLSVHGEQCLCDIFFIDSMSLVWSLQFY